MALEKLHEQLLLASGILATLAAIVAGATDIFSKLASPFIKADRLPAWAPWIGYLVIFALGLWLLAKWRMRYSRLIKPDAMRLDRDNASHLVGRESDKDALLQQCRTKRLVFLEGESGSGKSALVRCGLLPRLLEENRYCHYT
jgi:hypothetical protein